MKSVHGWVLLIVAAMAFWLGWILRFFPSAWALLAIGVLALAFGISDMRRHDQDGSTSGSD